MNKKTSFIKLIRLWAMIFLIILAFIIIGIDFFLTYKEFNTTINKIQTDYIQQQKSEIKREVVSIIDMINKEKKQLGSGLYLKNTEAQMKERWMDRINHIRFGKNSNGYLFAATFDGINLAHGSQPDLIGKSGLEWTDSKGNKTSQLLIEASKKKDGGFVNFWWKKPSTGEEAQKIAYVKSFPDWNLFIASGVYIDDIEENIIIIQESLNKQLKTKILIFIFIVFISTIIISILLHILSKILKKDFNTFISFFNMAESSNKLIDTTKIKFIEFNKVAESANKMINCRKLAEKELHDSEDRFKSLFEKAPLSYQSLDEHGYIIEVNQTWLEELGYTKDQVVGKSISDFLKPAWRNHFIETFPQFKSLGEVLGAEFELIKGDGSSILMSVNGRISKNTDDSFKQTHCVLIDITERKRAEDALRKSEEKFRSIFSQAAVGVARLNPNGTWLEVNKKLCDIIGYSEKEILTKTYQEVTHEDDLQEDLNYMDQLLNKKIKNYSMEKRYYRKDGNIIWVNLTVSLVLDSDNNPDYIISIIEDITNQKEIESKIIESEFKFRGLFETMTQGAIIQDGNKNIIQINNAACKILELEEKDIIGKLPTDWRLINKDGTPYIMSGKHVKNAYIGVYVPNKDIYKWLLVSSVPQFKNEENVSFTTMIVFTDITDYHIAEIEHEKVQSQLIQSQKIEAIGKLAGGVAHDYNNMLTVILGYTEISLGSKELPINLRENLNQVISAAKRSSNITRQLLAFARKQNINPIVININIIIEDLLKMISRLIGEDINLDFVQHENLWAIKIDPSQVDQVMVNLCINSRDAITDIGHIIIETENKSFDAIYCHDHSGFTPGDYIMIAVSDNGCGMDKEILKNIFDPFFTTKSEGKGTGLGLSTVYGIVKQNNGFINVYSEVEKGTTFRIYFPKYIGPEQPLNIQKTKTIEYVGTETILIVEDEPSILEMISIILKNLGYNIIIASNPIKAIEIAKFYPQEIDLLITDVIMPEMNGRDLSNKIIELFPNIECIYMSGYTSNVIVHNGILENKINFIQKPFSRQDISLKIRSILDKKQNLINPKNLK